MNVQAAAHWERTWNRAWPDMTWMPSRLSTPTRSSTARLAFRECGMTTEQGRLTLGARVSRRSPQSGRERRRRHRPESGKSQRGAGSTRGRAVEVFRDACIDCRTNVRILTQVVGELA